MTETPFVPTIPNPFLTGAPVSTDSDMFFGREDDFAWVKQRLLAEEEGIVMLLVGARRSGKTSIMFQILNGKLGDQFMPVFIDMQLRPAGMRRGRHSDRRRGSARGHPRQQVSG